MGILRKADFPALPMSACLDHNGDDVNLMDGDTNEFICAGNNTKNTNTDDRRDLCHVRTSFFLFLGTEEMNFVDHLQVGLSGGSPLVCKIQGKYFLAGMVTFPSSCHQESLPTLFTNVQKHTGWIREKYSRRRRRSRSRRLNM